jgi:Rhamnan synthesis protein F
MLGIMLKAKRIFNRAIISSDLLYANISYVWQVINRIETSQYRLGDSVWSRDSQEALSDEYLANICVFVVYATEATLSTLSYLQALRDAGFAILVINNSVSSNDFLEALKPLCWRVYNRRNIGRDIGAFKDGVMYLFAQGILQQCRFLCLANDSMQFVPGINGADFTAQIKQFINTETGALFTHESHQIVRHYQSFFQLLDSTIVNSPSFYQFWNTYRPLSNREHCIHKGELALSQSVYNQIKEVRVLYTIDAMLASLRHANGKSAPMVDEILGIMPSQTRTQQGGLRSYPLAQLTDAALNRKCLDPLLEHYLSELIELSNPSHVAAFLFPIYLKCPLIKHDICFAGSYSVGKALLLFDEVLCKAGLEAADRNIRNQEFRRLIQMKGIPSDYSYKPVERALKGVTDGFQYTA